MEENGERPLTKEDGNSPTVENDRNVYKDNIVDDEGTQCIIPEHERKRIK